MESRRQRAARKPNPSLKHTGANDSDDAGLPHIAELIADGEITVGMLLSLIHISKPQPGTIHIELRQAQVRIEGNADAALVRVLLECLRG